MSKTSLKEQFFWNQQKQIILYLLSNCLIWCWCQCQRHWWKNSFFWTVKANFSKYIDEFLLVEVSWIIYDHLDLSALFLTERKNTKHIETIWTHFKKNSFSFYYDKTFFSKVNTMREKDIDDEWVMKNKWNWIYIIDWTLLFFNSENKEILATKLTDYHVALYENLDSWSHYEDCYQSSDFDTMQWNSDTLRSMNKITLMLRCQSKNEAEHQQMLNMMISKCWSWKRCWIWAFIKHEQAWTISCIHFI